MCDEAIIGSVQPLTIGIQAAHEKGHDQAAIFECEITHAL
jgi:hypothetical protein